MFSGKTERLIAEVGAAHRFGFNVQVFKPKVDARYSLNEVVSHSGQRVPATVVEPPNLPVDPETDFVAIDEAQFFGDTLPTTLSHLLIRGVHVTVSGLDLTFKGQPFHPMPALMALADEVVKVSARCSSCGKVATRTQRLGGLEEVDSSVVNHENPQPILIGGAESYQPRCLRCFRPGGV
jgi:thymidine kinase